MSDTLNNELRAHGNEGEIMENLGVVSLLGVPNRWNDSMSTTLEVGAITAGQQHLSGRGWSLGQPARSGAYRACWLLSIQK